MVTKATYGRSQGTSVIAFSSAGTCTRHVYFTMLPSQVKLSWRSLCVTMVLAAFSVAVPVGSKGDPVVEYLCDLGHRHTTGYTVPLPRNTIAVAFHGERLPSSEHAAPDWHTVVQPCSHEGGKAEVKAQQI